MDQGFERIFGSFNELENNSNTQGASGSRSGDDRNGSQNKSTGTDIYCCSQDDPSFCPTECQLDDPSCPPDCLSGDMPWPNEQTCNGNKFEISVEPPDNCTHFWEVVHNGPCGQYQKDYDTHIHPENLGLWDHPFEKNGHNIFNPKYWGIFNCPFDHNGCSVDVTIGIFNHPFDCWLDKNGCNMDWTCLGECWLDVHNWGIFNCPFDCSNDCIIDCPFDCSSDCWVDCVFDCSHDCWFDCVFDW